MSDLAPTIGGMIDAIDYAQPGPFTDLVDISTSALESVPSEPLDICRLARQLVIQPNDAKALGVADDRFAENQIRPAGDLVAAILALDPAPLASGRPPQRRVIGTCRHFAVLTCALLRFRGIPARARCGFGTYFHAGKGLDHWITEYWRVASGRWVRVDSEILGGSILARPDDLAVDEFLTGGEAWSAFRVGRIDAANFGVYGTEHAWGPAEIRGNAIRDLASLNKVETLPWDEWGRMDASYHGQTGPDYDELIDEIATACAIDDGSVLATLYRRDELRVPPELVEPARLAPA